MSHIPSVTVSEYLYCGDARAPSSWNPIWYINIALIGVDSSNANDIVKESFVYYPLLQKIVLSPQFFSPRGYSDERGIGRGDKVTSMQEVSTAYLSTLESLELRVSSIDKISWNHGFIDIHV
jgi:hypothetical protein